MEPVFRVSPLILDQLPYWQEFVTTIGVGLSVVYMVVWMSLMLVTDNPRILTKLLFRFILSILTGFLFYLAGGYVVLPITLIALARSRLCK